MKRIRLLNLIALFVCMSVSSVFGYEAQELIKAYEQIDSKVAVNSQVFEIKHDTIFHNDFILVLDSGLILFLEPIIVGADTTVFGAYYKGKGSVLFSPPVQMERDQLNRFVHSESFDKKISDAVLFFSKEVYDSLQTNLIISEKVFSTSELENFKKLHKIISDEKDFLYSFELLQSLTTPISKPFLLAGIDTQSKEKLMYMFNPYEREEIKFWLYNFHDENPLFELLNSYSQYNLDESYTNINGRDKSQLDILHYDIHSEIDKNGKINSRATMNAYVLSGPIDFLKFDLLSNLHIDSIVDAHNNRLQFKRKKYDSSFQNYTSNIIALFLNDEIYYKDTLELTFYYHGDIANSDIGELYVFAETNWYPTYGVRDKATFDLKFVSDRRYTLISCGELVERKIVDDDVHTNWSVKSEAANVSFNYGYVQRQNFNTRDVARVETYYSKELHSGISKFLSQDILIGIGTSLEIQVANDMINALRTYTHYFGVYPYSKLLVSEVINSHSQVFPGVVHLGFDSWRNSREWDAGRLKRAQVVARQWWGVGVGYETYHDQWLSEGFSDYAALLYYQAISENEKFLQKLKEYRNNIFSSQSRMFSISEELGPIALGSRTGSSTEKNASELVVYKKGAFVLHMLRNMMIDLKTMNEDSFFAMLKEFYGLYRGKKASTHEFQQLAEKHADIKLDWFFDQWVYRNYLPEYEFTYEVVRNDSTRLLDVNCSIKTKGVPDGFKMYLPLELKFDEDTKAYLRIFVDANDYSFSIPSLSRRPRNIILNPFESVLAKIKQ